MHLPKLTNFLNISLHEFAQTYCRHLKSPRDPLFEEMVTLAKYN